MRNDQGRWNALREWTVTGASRELDCMNATPLDGAPIANIGDSHPQNQTMLVTSHTFSQDGPFTFNVTANYSVQENDAQALLDTRTRIDWKAGLYSQAIDRDLYGTPIVNSAGDPFDPPAQGTFKSFHLRMTRYEPFFDLAKHLKFADTVNANRFNAGPLVIEAGQCLCEQIMPLEEYPVDAKVIRIAYDFEIRKVTVNSTSLPAFDLYMQDRGTHGWYDSGGGKVDEIVTAQGQQIGAVALDGTGKPLNSTLRIGQSRSLPIKNPNVLVTTYAPLSNSNITTLAFKLKESRDFAELKL